MKRTTQFLTALVFLSLVVFVSCNKDNDDDPVNTDPRDEQAAMLTGTWEVSSATYEQDPRSEWEGASISFTYNNETDEGTYTISGVPTDSGADAVTVFGADGATIGWTFAGESSVSTIVRDLDNQEMSITNLTDNALTLTFDVPPAGSRVAGFEGSWTFEFTK